MNGRKPDLVRSISWLARAYTDLGTTEQVEVAISLLEEVIDKGRETLHADPHELSFMRERLAGAQEKLREILGERSLKIPEEEQDTPGIAANEGSDSAVYQHFRGFTRRAPLMF
jgi:hypothetical protein